MSFLPENLVVRAQQKPVLLAYTAGQTNSIIKNKKNGFENVHTCNKYKILRSQHYIREGPASKPQSALCH